MFNQNDRKLVLFDYDGTSVDTAQMIVESTLEAFKRCGLSSSKTKKVKGGISQKLDYEKKATYQTKTSVW